MRKCTAADAAVLTEKVTVSKQRKIEILIFVIAVVINIVLLGFNLHALFRG
jgi:hypothetical protein